MHPNLQAAPNGTIGLAPEVHDQILAYNIAACRRQNKLREEGRLPIYRHVDLPNGGGRPRRTRKSK
jgi:hypothetical protein